MTISLLRDRFPDDHAEVFLHLGIVLGPLLQKAAVGQDRRQRVVDLVGNAPPRACPAKPSCPTGTSCSLASARFLVILLNDFASMPSSSLPEIVYRVVEVARADLVGGLHQLAHGLADPLPDEVRDEQAQRDDRNDGKQDQPELAVLDLAVHIGEVHLDVEHAEDRLVFGVRMACRLVARRPVVDRVDHGEYARRVGRDLVNAHPLVDGEPLQGRIFGVAGVAALGMLVDHGPDHFLAGRKRDCALLVENADLHDAGLVRDRIDDGMHFVFLVLQHARERAVLDRFAHLVRVDSGLRDQRIGLRADAEVGEYPDDDDRDGADGDYQLQAYPGYHFIGFRVVVREACQR